LALFTVVVISTIGYAFYSHLVSVHLIS
jgi:hypothetical protein